MSRKVDIQTRVFDISEIRELTIDEVREAITEESNLALCKFIDDKDVITWCLTEVDAFFPDDDFVTVIEDIALQVILQDDVYHQTLEGIDIYRRYDGDIDAGNNT